MTATELSDLVKGIAPVLKEQIATGVARAIEPIAERVARLGEQVAAIKPSESAYDVAVRRGFVGDEVAWLASLVGTKGDPGVNGQNAEISELLALARELEAVRLEIDAVKAISTTAKPVSLPDIPAMVMTEVAKAVADLPKPAKGQDGQKGDDGRSVTVEDVKPLLVDLVASQVYKAVTALPPPKDGIGLAGSFIDRDGGLVVTLSDGKTQHLGVVVGAPGSQGPKGDPGESIKGDKGDPGESVKGDKGEPGENGFGFDDLDVTYDGERMFTFTFTKGDRSKSFPFRVAAVIYRGLYDASTTYNAGDEVTYAACQWIARDTSTGVLPDEHIPNSKRLWTLSAKRGERGRTGPPGPEGKQGPRGEKGDVREKW